MTITREPRRILFVYGLQQSVKQDSLLRGNVFDWLKAERIPAQWSPRLRGWRVRTERVGDIIARAEASGVAVRMRGTYVMPAEPPERVVPTAASTPRAEVSVDGQLALLEVTDA